ncbi:MAG: DUF2948 family protein [Pseudomonadota bacterium]
MALKKYEPLALLVADEEDLQVMSAIFQDSVAKVGDMAYLPEQRRFALVANRFVWEEGATKKRGPYTRVRAGLHFDDVLRVRTKSVRLDAKGAVVDILSIGYEGATNAGGTVTLTLAGGGVIALEVDGINAMVHDISDPWRTQSKPDHEGG